LLLDLVAMLIADVHAKWTAGSPAGAPLASGARFSSRHCKGAPATPFTSPISCFAPVEYWQNSPDIRSAGKSCRSSGCRLESGGAENRLAAIALQNPSTKSALPRPMSNSTALDLLPASAVRVILF
jgi:hypothetical protein